MTLIASYITKFGIIQASDSNLTNDNGNAGFGQKVFPIPHLNASLAYSGVYSIDGNNIDTWMNEYISGSFFTTGSIEEFTAQLSERMTREMRPIEIEQISIVHIAGYQKHENRAHIEHWHISNTGLNLEDGSYSPANNQFGFSCDFNSRLQEEHRALLRQFDNNPSDHTYYINGFPPGRMSSQVIKQTIDQALNHIWEQPDWRFRRPNNIFEFSNVVKLYFDFVARLFPMSDYNAMYIGGEIQTHLIPAPQDLWKD
jgi:hypothetical protein